MLKYYNYDIVFQEIPNEVTLAVNITNCPNRCKGCHSPHLLEDVGNVLDETCVINMIDKYVSSITCFCFMGGDAAPNRVNNLASFIQNTYPDLKVAWYSGFTKLPKNFNTSSFNFIKLGGYVQKYGTLESDTSNQHFYEIQSDGFMKDVTYRFKAKNI